MKRACSTAISALEATLKIVKEAAGHAGPPGLQTGISGLLFVIGVIKVSRHNSVLDAHANDHAEIVSKRRRR